MSYLIDGYNLLYILGLIPNHRGPPGTLHRARLRLLDLLHEGHGAEAVAVTVIFDAREAPPAAVPEYSHHSIQVRFAVHREADDLIEEMIRQDATPQNLTVVSNDHRIQQAGRRRNCQVLGCNDYLDRLYKYRRAQALPPEPDPAKPELPTNGETELWLREFAGLDAAPEWKELFEPFDFETDDEK